jgi:DNA polymerase-4
VSRSQLLRGERPTGPPGDDTGCPVLHVDMDAFYAGVELRSRPDLAGRPVIVGGASGRAVVLSATYEARAYGVHSAMPMARARRLCPQATVIEPSHGSYAEASRAVMTVLRDVTPYVEPLSLDEAFLDVAGAVRRLGRPAAIGERIRREVSAAVGLTCSVGVAATKFVAKMASARAKPDGLLVVPRAETIAFLHPLPVGALWGVGERTEATLARLGLRTVGDIAATPTPVLERELGGAAGRQLAALAAGRDDRPVTPDRGEASIGHEHTFDDDVRDVEMLRRELLAGAARVAARLRGAGLAARTVSIKVRFADFRTVTRARTLPEATDVGQPVYAAASALLDGLGLGARRVRLIGVRVEGLAPAVEQARQLAFDDGAARARRDAELVADQAARRFGPGALHAGSLLSGGVGRSGPGKDPERTEEAARRARG